jgi:DNA-binding SARP family transcriptional activator/DNA-binding beta-propeller fold protein YncE
VEYRILGPLEISTKEGAVAVAAGRERTLLLLLLLHRPHPVSVDSIVEALWRDEPPSSAPKVVQNYVLRLRKALGHDVVATVGHSYALRAAEDELDAARAASLLAAGRDALVRGGPKEADRLLGEGLGLWRGEPLADVRYEDFAQAEIARLDELRLSAVEDRNDAQLRLGEHARLVSELEQQVRNEPLRERLRGQLMLALYRSGRQADALAAYQAAREALDERGLEPSRELRDLERSILNQDSDLDARPAVYAQPVHRAFGHRKPLAVATGVAIALTALAAGIYRLTRGSEAPISSLAPNSVAEIDAGSGHVRRSFPVGSTPIGVAVSPSATWVTNFDDRTVSRIDLRSGQQKVVGSPSTPTGIAVETNGVWVISSFDGTVERLDTSGAGVLAVLRLRPGLKDVAAGTRGVWVTNASDGTLSRIDPATNEVASTLHGFAKPSGVALGADRIWVAEAGANRLDAVSPETARVVLRVSVQLEPSELAFGDGALWATNPRDSTVTRVDPYSGQQQIVSVGPVPSHVAVSGNRVWVTLDRDHSLVEIDARTGAVRKRLNLANPDKVNRGHTITPGGLAASAGSAWISVEGY